MHRRAVSRALCRSGALYHSRRTSSAHGARDTPRRPPMGTELQARDLDASASGAAELSEWRRGVADGRWPWVACGCRADRGGGAFYIDRYYAHEPQAHGARPRSRFHRDAHAAGALGPSPYGPDDTEHAGNSALHMV